MTITKKQLQAMANICLGLDNLSKAVESLRDDMEDLVAEIPKSQTSEKAPCLKALVSKGRSSNAPTARAPTSKAPASRAMASQAPTSRVRTSKAKGKTAETDLSRKTILKMILQDPVQMKTTEIRGLNKEDRGWLLGELNGSVEGEKTDQLLREILSILNGRKKAATSAKGRDRIVKGGNGASKKQAAPVESETDGDEDGADLNPPDEDADGSDLPAESETDGDDDEGLGREGPVSERSVDEDDV
ncbi:hypothetical protein B0H13DRAFT_2261393 [Mycena leptocephala]|nr:hypothetical protein B0H13DRAFT_2261393 [Mycena leptocephala]